MNPCAPTSRSKGLLASAALLVILNSVAFSPVTAGASSTPAGPNGAMSRDVNEDQRGARRGRVLPASADPFGYSLTDMAELVAPFTISGNDPAVEPDTPFQILHTLGFANGTPDGEGLLFSGANEFTVDRDTTFYVPILNVDDTDPVLGVFPTTPAEARRYIRQIGQVGARAVQVVIDGRRTRLGLNYVAGPVPSTLTNHIITIGAFIAPLPPGRHTVTVSGGFFGDLIVDTYDLEFIRSEFTYTINVLAGHPT